MGKELVVIVSLKEKFSEFFTFMKILCMIFTSGLAISFNTLLKIQRLWEIVDLK